MSPEKIAKIKEVTIKIFKDRFGDLHISNPNIVVEMIPDIYRKLEEEKLLPEKMNSEIFFNLLFQKLQETIIKLQFNVQF